MPVEPLSDPQQKMADVLGDTNLSQQARELLQVAANSLDYDRYRVIQHRFHDAVMTSPPASRYKYLDLPFWLASKIVVLEKLQLIGAPPMRILDLGAGPCHFSYLAKAAGHDVQITDLDPGMPVYADLVDFFDLKSTYFRINPLQPLPKFDGRFDLIVALWLSFDHGRDNLPWKREQWRFFLRDIAEHHLTQEGRIYLELNQHFNNATQEWYFEQDALDYFEMIGAQVDRTRGFIYLK